MNDREDTYKLEISTEGCSKHRVFTTFYNDKVWKQFNVKTEDVDYFINDYSNCLKSDGLDFKIIRKDLS